METYCATHGGRLVRMGRTHDVECSRTTNRLQDARAILKTMGIEPRDMPHTDTCGIGGGNHAICTCMASRSVVWPEWVTATMFDQAYALADAANTARGAYNRSRAALAKAV